nr:hypothetical protein [Tanacetum cinerariifolium]
MPLFGIIGLSCIMHSSDEHFLATVEARLPDWFGTQPVLSPQPAGARGPGRICPTGWGLGSRLHPDGAAGAGEPVAGRGDRVIPKQWLRVDHAVAERLRHPPTDAHGAAGRSGARGAAINLLRPERPAGGARVFAARCPRAGAVRGRNPRRRTGAAAGEPRPRAARGRRARAAPGEAAGGPTQRPHAISGLPGRGAAHHLPHGRPPVPARCPHLVFLRQAAGQSAGPARAAAGHGPLFAASHMITTTSFTREWMMDHCQQRPGLDPSILEKMILALTLVERLVETGLPFTFKGGTCLPPFRSFAYDATRSHKDDVPRGHYYVFYDSALDQQLLAEHPQRSIAIDLLFEEHNYPQGKELEIIKQLFDVGVLFDQVQDVATVAESFAATVAKELRYRHLTETSPADVLADALQTALLLAQM